MGSLLILPHSFYFFWILKSIYWSNDLSRSLSRWSLTNDECYPRPIREFHLLWFRRIHVRGSVERGSIKPMTNSWTSLTELKCRDNRNKKDEFPSVDSWFLPGVVVNTVLTCALVVRYSKILVFLYVILFVEDLC